MELLKKNYIITIILLLIFASCVYAQDTILICKITKEIEQEKEQKKESEYKKWIENGAKNNRIEPYLIPVVFHISHDYGFNYYQESQIIELIERTNLRFANEGEYYDSLGVDTNIRFCLAKKEENGKIVKGIVYSDEFNKIEEELYWDEKEYINVRILPMSTYAGLHSTFNYNGDILQVISLASPNNIERLSSVLTHELGHYFQLAHTFQNTPLVPCNNNNCLLDGDFVCDTPPHQRQVISACEELYNSCDTDVNIMDSNNPFKEDQLDPDKNYMSYGSCRTRFTSGQLARMEFFLNDSYFQLHNDSASKCISCSPISIELDSIPLSVQFGEILNIENNTLGGASFRWYINDELISENPNLVYEVVENSYLNIRLEAQLIDGECFEWNHRELIHVYCNEADYWIDEYPVFVDDCINFNISYEGDNLVWQYNGVEYFMNESTLCLEASNEVLVGYGDNCLVQDSYEINVIDTQQKQQFFGKIEFGNISESFINNITQMDNGNLLIAGYEINHNNNIDYGYLKILNPMNVNDLKEYQISSIYDNINIETIDAISHRDDFYILGRKKTDFGNNEEMVFAKINQSGRLAWSKSLNFRNFNGLFFHDGNLHVIDENRILIHTANFIFEYNNRGEKTNQIPINYFHDSEDLEDFHSLFIDELFIKDKELYIYGRGRYYTENVENNYGRFVGRYNENNDSYDCYFLDNIDSGNLGNKILIKDDYYFLTGLERRQVFNNTTSKNILYYDLKLLKLDSNFNIVSKSNYSLSNILGTNGEEKVWDLESLDIISKDNGSLVIYTGFNNQKSQDPEGISILLEIDNQGIPTVGKSFPFIFEHENKELETNNTLFKVPNSIAYYSSNLSEESFIPSINISPLNDLDLFCTERLHEIISYEVKDEFIESNLKEITSNYTSSEIEEKVFPLSITKRIYEPSFVCDTTFILPDYSLIVDSTYRICNDSIAIQFEICRDSLVYDNQIPITVYKENPLEYLEQINPIILDTFINWTANVLCAEFTVNVPILDNTTDYTVFLNSKNSHNQPFELRYRYFDAVKYLESNYLNNWVCIEIPEIPAKKQLISSTDTVLCYGDSLLLEIEGSYDFIEWSTGDMTSSTIIDTEGIVYLSVIDSCGLNRNDSILVEVINVLNDLEITISASDSLQATGGIELDCSNLNLEFSLDGGDWQSSCYFEMVNTGSHVLSVRNEIGCYQDTTIIVPIDLNVGNNNIFNYNTQLDVFPNPAKETLNVQLENATIQTLKIYNLVGQEVLIENVQKNLIQISTNRFTAGIYIVEVRTHIGVCVRKKVMIE